ncbi:hypothetical protein D3C74_446900 [compost metagenome]
MHGTNVDNGFTAVNNDRRYIVEINGAGTKAFMLAFCVHNIQGNLLFALRLYVIHKCTSFPFTNNLILANNAANANIYIP